VEEGIKKIESSVKQAEAAMAEMRARMISGSSAGLAEQGSDPLREAVGRMKALSSSLSEAQEMLQVREQ
jgi:methyl-accepting chemotaxis protein